MAGIRLSVLGASAAVLLLIASSAAGSPGAVDPSFGQGGSVTGVGFPGAVANALLLQPDGKLLAVGAQFDPIDVPPPGHIVLARYNADGSLDMSFGIGGVVMTAVAGGDAGANAAVLQPDGRIVVAGYYSIQNPPAGSTEYEFLLARYNADGALDASFGDGGVVTTQVGDFNSQAFGLVLLPDGKIVAGGTAITSVGARSVLARYLPNGALDTNFGTNGVVLDARSGESGFHALGLQPDGKLLGVGQSTPVTRYNADGAPDASFGSGGISGAPTGQANGLALQSDGKIVVVGGQSNSFLLVRVNPDGSVDPSFGGDGVVTTPMGDGPAAAYALAIQPDGKVVAAGVTETSTELITVARYNPGGSLDTSFGSGGVATTMPQGTREAGAFAVARQPDGKIAVAGFADPIGWVAGQFALARFLVTSTLSVSKTGSGSGAVASNPAGIECGSNCSASFAPAPVTLTATPAAGSVFTGWSGACSGTGNCTVTLSTDQTVTAGFAPAMNTLSVARAGRGRGIVTSAPTGIKCGSTCSRPYAYGTTVTLVARPLKGSVFKGWFGACSSARKSCSLTMEHPRSATAVFRRSTVCVVPKVVGSSLGAARRKIRRAHCRVGEIRHRPSNAKKGLVISQSPRPRRHLRNRSKVGLVLSSGSTR